jgi:hypothetical protein
LEDALIRALPAGGKDPNGLVAGQVIAEKGGLGIGKWIDCPAGLRRLITVWV